MNARTLKALKGSIKKWEKIVAGTGEDLAASNCPLCQLFLAPADSCRGCPVYEQTGRDQCDGTPYYGYVAARRRARLGRGTDSPPTIAMTRAAKRELAFLKRLLPKGEKP